MVQLRSGADVVQKHVIHIWSEVFLGDGVILQQQQQQQHGQTHFRCTKNERARQWPAAGKENLLLCY